LPELSEVANEKDLDRLIKSNYLTDPYVRFVIVNSISYLQECKDSLNFLKQKYAESEMKYESIIEKYQGLTNDKNQLQNNCLLLENNLHQLMEENQALNEEKNCLVKI
jgi:chromosome segregation ATPase